MESNKKKGKYYENFKKRLEKESIDPEKWDVEWIYAGGNYDEHENYYNKRFKNIFDIPCLEERCICGHLIKNNGYIMSEITKKPLVVGSCCIKKFLPKNKRTCDTCDELFSGRKYSTCLSCRKNTIINFGEYSGKNFDYILHTDPKYLLSLFYNNKYGPFVEYCKKNEFVICEKLGIARASPVMKKGKYEGKTYDEVLELNPSSILFVMTSSEGESQEFCEKNKELIYKKNGIRPADLIFGSFLEDAVKTLKENTEGYLETGDLRYKMGWHKYKAMYISEMIEKLKTIEQVENIQRKDEKYHTIIYSWKVKK